MGLFYIYLSLNNIIHNARIGVFLPSPFFPFF
jgi:hypothetical protein